MKTSPAARMYQGCLEARTPLLEGTLIRPGAVGDAGASRHSSGPHHMVAVPRRIVARLEGQELRRRMLRSPLRGSVTVDAAWVLADQKGYNRVMTLAALLHITLLPYGRTGKLLPALQIS